MTLSEMVYQDAYTVALAEGLSVAGARRTGELAISTISEYAGAFYRTDDLADSWAYEGSVYK